MEFNVELLIEELTKEITRLTKEKALHYVVAVQKTKECEDLKQELEKYQKEDGE